MQREDAQYIKMIESPIPKLIISLAIPTIISMLITSFYNMADTYFVAKLGTSEAGAVGIVFSLMAIIQAIGFTIAAGLVNIIPRLLGEKRQDEAEEIISSGFFSAIVLGLCVLVFGLIFIDDFMKLLGATETILPYATDYAKYIMIATPIMMASFVLNGILRAQGRALFAMIGIGFGGILNIIIDPIFIFTLDLGISGAAIATLISQCVSFSILVSIFIRNKSIIKINIKKISKRPIIYFLILKKGAPSLFRQGLASIATVFLNTNAALYGDAAIAAMSIVNRVFYLILFVMLGFAQGYQPVAGYNYGAKKYQRLKEAFRFTLVVGTCFFFIASILLFIFAFDIISVFRKEDFEVISIGGGTLRMISLVMPFIMISIVANMTLQSLGKSSEAILIASLRQGLFFLPYITILPRIFGLRGIQMSQPLAELSSAIVCIFYIYLFFKRLKEEDTKSRIQ